MRQSKIKLENLIHNKTVITKANKGVSPIWDG